MNPTPTNQVKVHMPKIKVLMVCMGNICRSPMAEAVFRDLVEKKGLGDQFEVDSAGTSSYHVSEPAHKGTLNVLSRQGIPYNGRARQIERSDLDTFDYVMAMDRENLTYIRRASGGSSAQIGLFLGYAKAAGKVNIDEMPDPYYDNNFDKTYDLVRRGSEALLDYIRAERKI